MNTEKKKLEIMDGLQEVCGRMFGCSMEEAAEKQAYKAVCVYVRELLAEKRRAFQKEIREQERKQVYYMSMEFLVGTSLRNNLFNLGVEDLFTKALAKCGVDIHELY